MAADRYRREDRAGYFRRALKALDHERPPYPGAMGQVVQQLRSLAEFEQDQVQREAREALIEACEAYERKGERGDSEGLNAIAVARHGLVMTWEYETGEMIPPSFLPNWRER